MESGAPIAAEQRYVYVVERGPVAGGRPRRGKRGRIDRPDAARHAVAAISPSAATQQQSKVLMRALINHYLGDQVLHTRQLLRDLQEL